MPSSVGVDVDREEERILYLQQTKKGVRRAHPWIWCLKQLNRAKNLNQAPAKNK